MIRGITENGRAHILRARDFDSAGKGSVLEFEYDACVIGSGPGGAVAAATLASAGLKVILLERGPFLSADRFNFRVLDMSNRAGHVEVTSGFRTLLFQGNVLGGGSIIYGGVAMKPPDFVFEEWKDTSGVGAIDARSLQPHYDHVAKIMSVTQQQTRLENRANAIVREMASVLGRPEGLEIVHRYTQGCAGVGLCNLGCGFNLKGTMLNSFLPLALETGNLTVFTEAEAVNLGGEAELSVGRDKSAAGPYRATGVGVILRDFATGRIVRRAFIKSRSVFLAAGAYFSSALLLRTRDFPGRNRIGRKIYLQPHAQVFAIFDEPITARGGLRDGQYIPRNGIPAIYNFTGYLKEHRFFWLASILFPANLASFISNLPVDEHLEIMRKFHSTMSITLTLRDDPSRSYVRLREGRRPELDFKESDRDLECLRNCFVLAARAFLGVGARQVFLPMLRPPRIEKETDLKKIEAMKFSYDDLLLYSDHTSSGNPYGANPARGVADQYGRMFEARNVFVVDSSLFPTACGVNPSWTIMALSRYVTSNAAEI